jgi:hypothetical protein
MVFDSDPDYDYDFDLELVSELTARVRKRVLLRCERVWFFNA